jgi:hypothetical protein
MVSGNKGTNMIKTTAAICGAILAYASMHIDASTDLGRAGMAFLLIHVVIAALIVIAPTPKAD